MQSVKYTTYDDHLAVAIDELADEVVLFKNALKADLAKAATRPAINRIVTPMWKGIDEATNPILKILSNNKLEPDRHLYRILQQLKKSVKLTKDDFIQINLPLVLDFGNTRVKHHEIIVNAQKKILCYASWSMDFGEEFHGIELAVDVELPLRDKSRISVLFLTKKGVRLVEFDLERKHNDVRISGERLFITITHNNNKSLLISPSHYNQ